MTHRHGLRPVSFMSKRRELRHRDYSLAVKAGKQRSQQVSVAVQTRECLQVRLRLCPIDERQSSGRCTAKFNMANGGHLKANAKSSDECRNVC